ncbi:ciliary-associated calcium-binding coiled-coil protein 1 isoform X1 [Misgurnus anguillicaudatus]|uniref:ciliary-associated calcium-binding coiled-coil protein 1 isoform X1 n=1 Tax=Misgurnus anguillicaudatus TaxID=75329 RepID=UPI003CCF7CCB
MSEGEKARTENSKNKDDEENMQLNKMKIPFPQWKLLDHNQIKKLLDLPVEEVQLQFKGILDLKNHQTCMKDAALLDYFVNGFWWAKEMNFTYPQILFIMALLQQLLDNISNKQTSFADNVKVFTQTMNVTGHQSSSSAAETDASVLFDAVQIRSITDYFRTSVFQHYRLYESLFTQRKQQLVSIEKCIEVVTPVDFVPPLEEGMPADLYFQYVAPPRVQTPEQESLEQNGDDPGKAELEENDEDQTDFNIGDVRDVLEEITQEMLAQLQADFTEKMRAHEEIYTSRLERLQEVLLRGPDNFPPVPTHSVRGKEVNPVQEH